MISSHSFRYPIDKTTYNDLFIHTRLNPYRPASFIYILLYIALAETHFSFRHYITLTASEYPSFVSLLPYIYMVTITT